MSMIGGEKNCEDATNVVEDQKEPDISEFEYVQTEEELKGKIVDLEQENKMLRGELRAQNDEIELLRAAKKEMATEEEKVGILEHENKLLKKLLKEVQHEYYTETIAKSVELVKLKEELERTKNSLLNEKLRAVGLQQTVAASQKRRLALAEQKMKEVGQLEQKNLELSKELASLKSRFGPTTLPPKIDAEEFKKDMEILERSHEDVRAEFRENLAKGVYGDLDTAEKQRSIWRQLFLLHAHKKDDITRKYGNQIEELKKELATAEENRQDQKVEVPENGFVADVEFFRPRC